MGVNAYHPPSADGYTDVLRWYLVAVPDKPEYIRAAEGAYTDLAHTWKWDGSVGSPQDAVDSYALAIAATLETLEMGFPDELLGYIDEVEQLLESLQFIGGCCDGNDASDGSLYTDNVSDGVGNVPQNIIDAGYALNATDWASFADYKCMIAHVLVDDMESKLRKIAPFIDAAGSVIGGVSAIIGIITVIWTSGLTALAGAILASTGAAATLYKNLADQASTTSLADDIASNHNALACAFYDGTDGVDAAIAALKAEIDNLFGPIDAIILKNLNIEPAARALYAGRYDQQDIAQKLADAGYDVGSYDCSCEAWDFVHDTNTSEIQAGTHQWIVQSGTQIRNDVGECSPNYAWHWTGEDCTVTPTRAMNQESYPVPASFEAFIHKIEFFLCHVEVSQSVRCIVNYADATEDRITIDAATYGDNPRTITFDTMDPTKPVKLGEIGNLAVDIGGRGDVSDVKIYWEINEL